MFARRAAEAENYEEVYLYTAKTLEIDPSNKEAMLLKGFASGMLLRITEAKKYFEWAIGFQSKDFYNDRFKEAIEGLTESQRLCIAYLYIGKIAHNLYFIVRSYIEEATNIRKLGRSEARELKINSLYDKANKLNVSRIYFLVLYYRILDGIRHSHAPENQEIYRKLIFTVIDNMLIYESTKYKRMEINMREAISYSDFIMHELSGTDLIRNANLLKIIDGYKNSLIQ
ncbi:MAG: hypothetical protein ACP5EQ_07865 [Candidatus Cloacimonadia bacterium]